MLPPFTTAAGIEIYARLQPPRARRQRRAAEPRRCRSCSRRSWTSWPARTCATSGRKPTSSTGERWHLPSPACRHAAAPIAVTLGDPAGIGPDITLAAWRQRARPTRCIRSSLYGDPDVMRERARALALDVPVRRRSPARARPQRRFLDALPVLPIRPRAGGEAGRRHGRTDRRGHRGRDRRGCRRRGAGARHQPDRQDLAAHGPARLSRPHGVPGPAGRPPQRRPLVPPGHDAGGGRAQGRAGHGAHSPCRTCRAR